MCRLLCTQNAALVVGPGYTLVSQRHTRYQGVQKIMSRKVSHERWKFAQWQERMYQEKKSRMFVGRQFDILDHARNNSTRAVHLLDALNRSPGKGLVVEVGSGAHGLIWQWPAERRIAIDPLADYYQATFSSLQTDGPMVLVAQGERLPLESDIADLVLSDNVLDHTEAPSDYLGECLRILKPKGTFFLTVDVHHPIWWWCGCVYNGLFRLGFRRNVPAFPNHPFHFSESRIEKLLLDNSFRVTYRRGGPGSVADKGFRALINVTRQIRTKGSGLEAVIKQIFFKNIRLEIVASAGLSDSDV